MDDIRVETIDTITYLISPYNPDVPPAARAIGGRWDGARKAWKFDSRDEERVRSLAREVFGTDGTPEAAVDLVTVRIDPAYHQIKAEIRFAGRRIG